MMMNGKVIGGAECDKNSQNYNSILIYELEITNAS